jgi:predicted amidophosphoribosyltransferase
MPATAVNVREEPRRVTMPRQARSPAERARQVRGAFAVRSPRRVHGRVLALVDDVVTSGATAQECARVLLAAGARRVVLFAAAGNG